MKCGVGMLRTQLKASAGAAAFDEQLEHAKALKKVICRVKAGGWSVFESIAGACVLMVSPCRQAEKEKINEEISARQAVSAGP